MSRYGKRILAAGVCATMTMGLLTGCSSSTGKTVAKMGDAEITLGEAEFMLRYNQAKTQGYLGALFGEGSNVFQQDLTGSGQAYGVTMKESVMNDLKDMILMEQHMSDYNVELTDEEKAAITTFFDYFYDDARYTEWVDMEGFLPATKTGGEALAAANEDMASWIDILDSCKFYPTAKAEWADVKQGVINVEQNALLGGDVQELLDDLQAEIAG